MGSNKIVVDAGGGNVDLTIVANPTSGGVAAGDAAIISETGLATFNAATTSLTDKIMSVEAGIQTGVAAAAGQTAVFNHDGAAYLFISEGTDGVGAGDMLIKLVGITATTGLTIDGSGDLIGVA